ncbi:hypothetical protein ABL78_5687 [Leptomonas seymouri]|uniref:Plant heme peroxidase family profile domain-containing protein n=1 Tax=Leptomonas seymouri TaxID=5684 RepID=A0A0N1PCF6_LEPSE|nr:hypothetical protein ABL78_5687 [Leptomonas seymouri]|eukprot:KPI85270.1 hypothetical protein ABL78_5687 [Leptomonas seymouri]
MLRASLVRRRGVGAFRRTPRTLLWWGYKESDLHRLARQRPWWETAAILCGLLVFVNVSSAAFYFLNRWYQKWRPSGNELRIREAIDQKLFSRPDLAVAAVRMMLHHALSNTQTPFGCPIVAPEEYKPEAEAIVDFIWDLNKEQPNYTFPDLWAMFTAKAVARLGGPNVTPYRGREDPPDFMTRESLLAFTPALINEGDRDVLNMKRVLSRQGFSLEQLVALIGCYRCIGFHDVAHFHTQKEVKPKIRPRPGTFGPSDDEFHLPDTIQKTTMDPYVFGVEYYDLLLDYNWHQQGIFKKRSDTEYRCSANDRTRNVTLLDPFSEKAIESERRWTTAADKAREVADEAKRRKAGDVNDKDGVESGTRLNRSGEAQFIPGATQYSWEDDGNVPKKEIDPSGDPDYEIEHIGAPVDPCQHVSMRGMDVMLLDDSLTKGWLHRFGDNELEFYAAVSDVILDIQKRGHNPNMLAVWK